LTTILEYGTMRSIEWEKTNETMPDLQSGVLA
jgi:hypothetical protein